MATFLNTWASYTRAKDDSINISDNFFMDCTTIFPPKEVHGFSVFQFGKNDQLLQKMAARIVNILALNTKTGPISRVEAVLAVVW
ncbi:hypothetical protein P3S67_027425 [Capsicum chacoense]